MAGNPIVDELEGRVKALLGSKAQFDPVGKKVNPPELEAHLNSTYAPAEGVTLSLKSAKATVGDSLTRGYDSGGDWSISDAWPAKLADLDSGATIVNLGRSGMTVDEIGIHVGALVLQCTVAGGSIPASGAVTVNIPAGVGWRPNRTWTFTGSLAGVPGTLTRTTTATTDLTFTRTNAGSVVPVSGSAPFIVDTQIDRWSTLILGVGRNNVSYDVKGSDASVAEHVIKGTQRLVDHLAPTVRRFLLWGTTTSTAETRGTPGHTTITAINAELASKYPLQFVDLRKYLVERAITDLGLTPTAGDQTAIANDTIPPQLMVPGDTIHLAKTVHPLMASFFEQQLARRDWIAPGKAIPTAPGQVTGVVVSGASKTLLVSWTKPASSPAPTSYELNYRAVGQTAWTSQSSTATSSAITSLANGTAHEVRVRAANGVGYGPWSDVVTGTPNAAVIPPLSGASQSWLAAGLTDADLLASWPSAVSGLNLANSGGAARPVVASESGVRFVRFDGIDDMLHHSSFAGTQPHTRVLRYRLQGTPQANRMLVGSTGTGTGGNSFSTLPAGATNYQINAGTALTSAPPAVPDTAWHTAIVVFNGASSVLAIDGVETVGDAGANAGVGIRLAAFSGSTPSTFTQMDVAALEILPYAADASQRAAIRSLYSSFYS
ncbi:fibronectin type III domain protein [Rhodococcus sp. OK519]|uniref:fibronectin type III domain-containing protein n=1 Tax=Rhodococcus sp. OK519 TaxID=2135729 RepID=UPI000D37848F|nr:fibronectin type III domain protein [Rhodococcus sp. OK519]